MFPISAVIPHDTGSFHAALTGGLAPLGLGSEAVQLQGDFPRLDAIRVDLTGARFHRGLKVSKPAGSREPLAFAREVHLTGQPVLVEGVPVALQLSAQDVVLAVANAESGEGRVLLLERANGGKMELSASRIDLEKALFAAGQAAASSKGAEVKSVELRLRGESPRSLAVEAVITAKAMFFTTTVTVAGRVELDEQLNARLRDLHCEGDGMIGKMAAGVLRPQFEQLQQREFPLGRAVAGLALEDVTLTGGDELRIRATFRSAA